MGASGSLPIFNPSRDSHRYLKGLFYFVFSYSFEITTALNAANYRLILAILKKIFP